MSSHKHHATLADYVTIALSPVLIMALVGSLVYFLVEVLYSGQWSGRVLWIMFFFVFGAVLLGRMSMQDGISTRAPIYGIILAIVVWVALLQFVSFEGSSLAAYAWAVNAGLMAVIWWSAHRLTWDCTFIDDTVDASGKGVLEAAGLDAPEQEEGETKKEKVEEKTDTNGRKKEGKKKDKNSMPLIQWWERYRRYREERRRKPHTPGVWVVYFSLAALPLFGLGQSLIPAEADGRRQYAFWLMGIYVASALGLLLTTCFLGLRRYLRQRKMQMPKAMTAVWLALGGGMIVVLLVAGALLPRPNAEYPLIDLGSLAGSKDRDASRYAVKGDSPGKGEGRGASENPPDSEEGAAGSGTKRDNQGGGQAEGNSGQGQGNKGSAQGQNKKGEGQGKKQGDQGSSGDKSTSNQQQEKKDGSEKGDKGEDSSKDKSEQKAKDGAGKPKDSSNNGSRPSDSSSSPPSSQSFTQTISSILGPIAKILKWVVFAILILVVGFFVVRAFLRSMANFTGWAARLLAALQAWWQGLSFWGRRAREAELEAELEAAKARPKPFSSFHNPFLVGDEMAPEELVRYSFEALEALAWERGLGRNRDETPWEFVGRVGEGMPGLEDDARRMAGFYVRTAYDRGALPLSCRDVLRQYWDRLDRVGEAPVAAGA